MSLMHHPVIYRKAHRPSRSVTIGKMEVLGAEQESSWSVAKEVEEEEERRAVANIY